MKKIIFIILIFSFLHSQHDHDHDHDHSHGVYKHIAHPNGPRTMIDQGVCCCFMSQFPEQVIEEERLIIKTRTAS